MKPIVVRLLNKFLPGALSLDAPILDTGRSLKDRLRIVWDNIWRIALRSDSDHIFLMAAGIAFNIAFAFVPTALILLFVLGYILNPEDVAVQLRTYLDRLLITSGSQNDIIDLVQSQVQSIVANRGLAGVAGFIGLLWTSSALATSIRVGINNILRCREQKNFLIYKLYDILTIILIGTLIFVSILIGPLLNIITSINERIAEAIPILHVDWFVSEGINILLALLLFYVIFRFTPYQRQSRLVILTGTVTSAILWTIARIVFTIYLTEFKTFSRVYGAYAILASTAFWIYYTALVFVIGAEVAYHIKQSTWNARRIFHQIADDMPSRRIRKEIEKAKNGSKETESLNEAKSA